MHRLVERGRGAGIPRSRGRFVPFDRGIDRIGCAASVGRAPATVTAAVAAAMAPRTDLLLRGLVGDC